MDRLNQLRNEAGGSGDSTLDTSSPPSEAYLTANDSSKYFSLLEDETNFDISKESDAAEAGPSTVDDSRLISNLSPIPKKSDLDSFKIGTQIEAANILSGGVDIFDDNDNSYDGDELVIDDNVTEVEPENEEESEPAVAEETAVPVETVEDNATTTTAEAVPATPSKNVEVVLYLDGNNVNAIDIGNGLYLYRRDGEEELAAVQIMNNTPGTRSQLKFLKVRENAEGNLEVYEEIEVAVPRDAPPGSESTESAAEVNTNETAAVVTESNPETQESDTVVSEVSVETNRETPSEQRAETNPNGRMKVCESRQSPVVGSFTPMTFHSTPNKEGIPLTKTMVDQQLHPSRHSDNVKKTIEVHTDHSTQRIIETTVKMNRDLQDASMAGPSGIRKGNNIVCDEKAESPDVTEAEVASDNTLSVKNKEQEVVNETRLTEENIQSVSGASNPDTVSVTDENKIDLPSNEINSEDSIENSEPDLKAGDLIINGIPNASSVLVDSNEQLAKECNDNDVLGSVNSTAINSLGVEDPADLKCNFSESNAEEKSEIDVVDSKSDAINTVSVNDQINEISGKVDMPICSPIKVTKITEIGLESASTSSECIKQSLQPKNNLEAARPSANSIDSCKNPDDISAKTISNDSALTCNINMTNSEEKTTDQKTDLKIAPTASKSIDTVKNTQQNNNPVDIDTVKNTQHNSSIKNPVDINEEDVQSTSHDSKHSDSTKEVNKIQVDAKSDSGETNSLEGNGDDNLKSIRNSTKNDIETKEKDAVDSGYVSTRNIVEAKSDQEDTKCVITDNKIEKVDIVPLDPKHISTDSDSVEIKQNEPEMKKCEKNQDDTKFNNTDIIAVEKAQSAPDSEAKDSKGVKSIAKDLIESPRDITHNKLADEPTNTIDSQSNFKTVLNHKHIDATDLKHVANSRDTHSTSTVAHNVTVSDNETDSGNKNCNEIAKSDLYVDTQKSKSSTHTDLKIDPSNGMKPIQSKTNLQLTSLKSPSECGKVNAFKIVDTIEEVKHVSNTNLNDKDLAVSNVDTKAIHRDLPPALLLKTQTKQIEIKKNNVYYPVKKGSSDNLTPQNSVPTGTQHSTSKKEIVLNSKLPKTIQIVNKDKNVAGQVINKMASSIKIEAKKDATKSSKGADFKPVSNNNTAVPFGKWTEANRQEFLNKIRETKVPINISNTKQIKQANDLNRRDILQKIDSQRQQQSNIALAKVQEQQKLNNKNESIAFAKSTVKHDTKIPIKERPTSKPKTEDAKKNTKDEPSVSQSSDPSVVVSNLNVSKKESTQRREINNQDLIDKTVEDLITRTLISIKPQNEESKQSVQNTEGIEKQKGMTLFGPSYHAKNKQAVTLDDIEMKMNELHGIPFVERPAHELPQKYLADNKQLQPQTNDSSKNRVPSILTFTKQSNQQTSVEEVLNIDSDDEVIEHEPITGDINTKRKAPEVTEKAIEYENNQVQKTDCDDGAKKDVIITEREFDKFFRRNSVTYENRLTVNFDSKEPHNVVQTVIEKDVAPKKLTRNEVLLAESKAKSTQKQQMLQARHNNHPTKQAASLKYNNSEEDSYGKNYQSKLQIAYHSALTAKRQKESPITIIEDKPVKVVFMESSVDFQPGQINIQGDKLSPNKKSASDVETFTHSTIDSLDSDLADNFDTKSQDDSKIKRSHQRKQVLTPVETPEMELIEPSDLGIEISPKKKRKIEEKREQSPKNHVPKKSYLLGRTGTDDKINNREISNIAYKEITNHLNSFGGQLNSISAIDNLVMAAELLDNQAESNSSSVQTPDSDSQQNTPAKRGRGRPRKYPLPDSADKNKVPSPQKKPRLIDAKVKKRVETDEEDTSDDEMIKENWTMGTINENIVCPICGKLFRSENVVFKHVKHCTGPSPNRSESDKRRFRESQESETRSQTSKSDDMEIEDYEPGTPMKRKSKERVSKVIRSDEVIVIEDTPLKEKPEKLHESRKSTIKDKVILKHSSNLVCEICGKTFRQASYLAHHKLSHKNEQLKKQESETSSGKSVFSCEVCKKEFRKLHHLVQHRIIHNTNAPTRPIRKSSSEQRDTKTIKEQNGPKPSEDQSAGFRCEPCDKSFRKLHHLVEHRETHDGINRQKATDTDAVKPTPTHQCDMCDKSFKKLQLLNEHKDQHLETCSEKSDDKSVKSSLSTKDIIHECSLCYMVFPNEHSLNKHTVICLRKKKQSAAKAKQAAEKKELEKNAESDGKKSEELDSNENDDSLIIIEDCTNPEIINSDGLKSEDKKPVVIENENLTCKVPENIAKEIKEERSPSPVKLEPVKKSSELKVKELVKTASVSATSKDSNPTSQLQTKNKQIDSVVIQVQHTPAVKKKIPVKEKVGATVAKRQKTVNVPLPVIDDVKPSIESSDEDEVRYMLNPDFKEEETSESKSFMKVKAKKRNSLQIERPSSRDLIKRRISLQHPPKISRLKAKSEQKSNVATTSVSKTTVVKAETDTVCDVPAPSTDSDDSDVKYSFPVTVKEDSNEPNKTVTTPRQRKSLGTKRKSLTGVAQRKSLGKVINSKHKAKAPPVKPIKKRTSEAEHRCDCGKLFSSAALLSRHTTLDHTPPRIRRRRSPEPVKPKADKPRPSQVPEAKAGVATRNSSNDAKPAPKGRRSTQKAPVPEKIRKLDKSRH